MFIRQIHYLLALSKTEHFGRAAEACHVSQPALSTAIQHLEEELGITPKVMLETDSVFALYAHVRSAGLYSVVPHSILNLFEMRQEVTALPLNPVLSREIGLIARRQDLPPPLQDAAWNIAQRLDLQHRLDSLLVVSY